MGEKRLEQEGKAARQKTDCLTDQLENTVISLEKTKGELEEKLAQAGKEKESQAAKATQLQTRLDALEKEHEVAKKGREESSKEASSMKEKLESLEKETESKISALKEE